MDKLLNIYSLTICMHFPTNYYKVSGLKNIHIYHLTVAVIQQPGHSLVRASAYGWNQSVGQSWVLIRGLTGEEPAVTLPWLVSRIYFLWL